MAARIVRDRIVRGLVVVVAVVVRADNVFRQARTS
jgi:hypothetical protein